ncbi:MAG: hypothetical protein Q4F85_03265 [Prevotella sp.]|nr:hypothetical protein [Prevotella sp.]
MKKIFTLIAVAMMAVSGAMAQTQKTEIYIYDGSSVADGSGTKVELNAITMTYTMGETASDLTWKSNAGTAKATNLANEEIEFTHYIQANGANGRTDLLKNTNCAYFKFEPKYDGTLQIMVTNVDTGKEICAAEHKDGVSTPLPVKVLSGNEWKEISGNSKLSDNGVTEKYEGFVNIDVKAGGVFTYCLNGSKGRIMGFSYIYTETADGIADINADVNDANAPAYNLAGQRVNANAKGLIIKNGKKYVNK